jgi:Holliday junction resolvasome RuvABC endonuclease subunit
MNAVGLDLSLTSTGVAHADGTASTLHTRETGVRRLWVLRAAIRSIVCTAEGPVDLVAVEGYSMGTARQSSHAHGLGELGGVIRLLLHDLEIPYVDIPPASVKVFATGKGNANKNDMLLAAARRLGYQGNSNDEADALWLRAMAMHRYGHHVVRVPVDHERGMAKVEWPALAESGAVA